MGSRIESKNARSLNGYLISGTPTTGDVLRFNGSEYVPGPDSVGDGDKGDLTVSGGVWTIDNGVVSNAKLADMAEQTIKGRYSAGTGVPQDIGRADIPNNLPVTGDYVFGWTAAGALTTWPAARYLNTMALGTTTAANRTPQGDSASIEYVNALAQTITFNAIAGSPVESQEFEFRITDDGTPRTIIWDASYTVPSGMNLPTTTIANQTLFLRFLYNATTTNWELQYNSYDVVSGASNATNLGVANRDATDLDVTSDTGTDATIPAATVSLSGLMTAADKTKLDGITAGASVGGNGTNNYVARWTPDGNTLGDSVIQDDGTTASIGATPSGTIQWYTLSGLTSTTTSDNNGTGASASAYAGNVSGAATTNYGTDINVYGATSEDVGARYYVGTAGSASVVSGVTYGGIFVATKSGTNTNVGVRGEAVGATSGNNVGGYFKAANATGTNHAITLEDGSEAVGKYLRCDTAQGAGKWENIQASDITGSLDETNGGTGQTTYTTGDILYASAANTLSKLAIGTNGHVLTVVGGLPVWQAAAGGFTSFSLAGDTGTPQTISDGNTATIAGGTGISTVAGATDTVTINHDAHTGDVTGSTALTIANDAVTYAKMQNVVADNVLLGNNSGAGGVVDELTAAEVRTLLNVSETGASANKPQLNKTLVIETPAATDYIPIFRTYTAITIQEAYGMLNATGDVDVRLYWDTDFAETAPTAIGTTTTLTTTSEASINIATDPTIPADRWVFLDIPEATTPQTVVIDLRYTED